MLVLNSFNMLFDEDYLITYLHTCSTFIALITRCSGTNLDLEVSKEFAKGTTVRYCTDEVIVINTTSCE